MLKKLKKRKLYNLVVSLGFDLPKISCFDYSSTGAEERLVGGSVLSKYSAYFSYLRSSPFIVLYKKYDDSFLEYKETCYYYSLCGDKYILREQACSSYIWDESLGEYQRVL